MRLLEDRLDDHLTDDEVQERFATLDRMMERRMPVICADPLGVAGAEAFARHGPSLGNMLIPFMVLFAFALGAFLAYLT